jgi:alpha-tubulin suppressor-like RCC1 family protein
LAVTLAITLLGALLVALVAPATAQAWEQVGVPSDGACPDVLVLSARGSGEEPQANGGVDPADYESDPYNGMGKVGYHVYLRLRETLPDVHIAYEGVQYAGEPVLNLDDVLGQPSLVRTPWWYMENAKAGARLMAAEIGLVDARCQHKTKFVLTGFSQGAWAVHRAIRHLRPNLRSQVRGVLMYGDPLYFPFQRINRVNNLMNSRPGVAFLVDLASVEVPSDLQARTGDYCFTHDPVCQLGRLNVFEHLSYVTTGLAKQGADFVRQFLPQTSTWTTITSGAPPDGAVDTPYYFAFTSDYGHGRVTWSFSGELPPGLDPSTANTEGILSGTPTDYGSYSFTVKATDSLGRSGTKTYRITIEPPPPPPCTSNCSTASAYAWGYNNVGQLGNDSTMNSSLPVQVSNSGSFKAVSAGENHNLALDTSGTVWAWGYNNYGQLGDGTTTTALTPVQVSGLSGVTAIAAGNGHSLAVRNDGTVWAWGRNDYGELGDGTTSNSSTPVQVQGLSGVTAIAADKGSSSMAVRQDGTVWAWGYNYFGQLGDGTTDNRLTPVQVSGLSGVIAIAAGSGHSLALTSDGSVWAWGSNGVGELGDGTTTDSLTPVHVGGLSGVTRISVSDGSSYALRSDKTVWAWGWNGYGQLSDGTTNNSSTPVQVTGLPSVIAISSGGQSALALADDGTVWAWGYNGEGELGDATTNNSSTPVHVIGLNRIFAVSAGWKHELALQS